MLLEADKSWIRDLIHDGLRALAGELKQKLDQQNNKIEALQVEITTLKSVSFATAPPPSATPPSIPPTQPPLPRQLPPGVSKHRGKYRARRKGRYLGLFLTPEKAGEAYLADANNATDAAVLGTATEASQVNAVAAKTPEAIGIIGTVHGTTIGTAKDPSVPGPSGAPTGNANGMPATTEIATNAADDAHVYKIGPKVFPVALKNRYHSNFFYRESKDGFELDTTLGEKGEFLGFFDSLEEVRTEIARFLDSRRVSWADLDTLFD